MLWIAPLLLGHSSQAHDRMRPFASSELVGQHCQVLDPRLAEVRAEVNKRLGADVVKDVLVDELNFVAKREVRS